jgi:hypothetical protein
MSRQHEATTKIDKNLKLSLALHIGFTIFEFSIHIKNEMSKL